MVSLSGDAGRQSAGEISPALLSAYAAHRQADLKSRRTAFMGAIALILFLTLLPFLSGGSFDLGRYSTAIIFIMAAIGLNLALGFGGELVLGHAVIMSAAAYSAGILSATFGWSFGVAFPLSVLSGTALGTLMMLPGIRVQGWYLALITLFAVLVLPHVVILLEPWTGGEFGLNGLLPIQFFGERLGKVGVYLFVVAMFATVWFLADNLLHSHWGYRFRALRDSKAAAEAVGISLKRTRFAVYVVASIPPSIGGALLAFSERFVHFDAFNINLSLMLLTGVVLGGQGTRWGPVIGMAPLLALSFWVGPFSPYNSIGLGVGLLLCTVVFPNGLVPEFERLLALIGRRAGQQRREAEPFIDLDPTDSDTEQHQSSDQFSPQTLLSVSGVGKSFGPVRALNDIHLDIARGRLVGLVGPNGSGKSTFLNVLSGFARSDQGQVRIAGIDVTNAPIHSRSEVGVGRTFQVPQVIEDLTPLANIELGLISSERGHLLSSLLRLPGARRLERQRERRALKAYAKVGLPAEILASPTAEIPLGLKRVVEVGRAIVAEPKLLLLDEPTAGLDDRERAHLGEVLKSLKETGMTILIVEHNVPFVLGICDEIVLLESGTIAERADCSAPLPERLRAYLAFAPDDGSLAEPGSSPAESRHGA